MLNIKSFSTGAVALTLALQNTSAITAPHTLFYDGYSVELTDQKKTSPALHIRLHTDEMTYGALYDTPAPEHSLHIRHNGIEYWVGKWCDAGTYLTEAKECADCGYGHYCTGGVARDVCTDGLIGCNTKNATADNNGNASLLNRLLTIEEVNQHIPATDISQWQLVAKCHTRVSNDTDAELRNNLSLMKNPDVSPCPITAMDAGTYLFVTVPGSSACDPSTYDYSEANNYTSREFIAIFNRPWSYRMVHASSVFSIFIDPNSPDFTTAIDDLIATSVIVKDNAVQTSQWCIGTAQTNVGGVTAETNKSTYTQEMYVYKFILK